MLKSPAHTARVALLLQLFPEAQFVYIHRDPLTVYQSAVHMAKTTYWYMYVATPTDEQIHEFILNQFEASGPLPPHRMACGAPMGMPPCHMPPCHMPFCYHRALIVPWSPVRFHLTPLAGALAGVCRGPAYDPARQLA